MTYEYLFSIYFLFIATHKSTFSNPFANKLELQSYRWLRAYWLQVFPNIFTGIWKNFGFFFKVALVSYLWRGFVVSRLQSFLQQAIKDWLCQSPVSYFLCLRLRTANKSRRSKWTLLLEICLCKTSMVPLLKALGAIKRKEKTKTQIVIK